MKVNEKDYVVGTTFMWDGVIYSHMEFFNELSRAKKYKKTVDKEPGIILCEIVQASEIFKSSN